MLETILQILLALFIYGDVLAHSEVEDVWISIDHHVTYVPAWTNGELSLIITEVCGKPLVAFEVANLQGQPLAYRFELHHNEDMTTAQAIFRWANNQMYGTLTIDNITDNSLIVLTKSEYSELCRQLRPTDIQNG